MSIKTLLRDELTSEIGELGKVAIGSDEYKATVDGVVKLTDRLIEMDKLEQEERQKEADRQMEAELKREQMHNEKKNNRVGYIVVIGTTLLSVSVTIWGTIKSIEFEKEGTITTIMGRGFVNKLLPKK